MTPSELAGMTVRELCDAYLSWEYDHLDDPATGNGVVAELERRCTPPPMTSSERTVMTDDSAYASAYTNTIFTLSGSKIGSDLYNSIYDELKKLVQTVRAEQAEADAWRPIETAPTPDKYWFLADVWCEHSASSKGERYADASKRPDGLWYDNGGNLLNWEKLDMSGRKQFRRVTHWMPLPTAPAAGAKPEGTT
jgi:hypothetical protein